jgi:hypothetical protein
MTTRTISGFLRAAVFGGSIGLLPSVALAGGGTSDEAKPPSPDHAQAEARGGAETTVPAAERTDRIPDHAQAEARGRAADVVPAAERTSPADHATVESRGADTK